MRLWKLTAADMRFQRKYGFYLLYAIFTAVYLLILSAIPDGARRTVATIMIFTDPAAMGLFFMGAIILLERSQRVDRALSISPLKVWEYMLAKLFSLSVIGLAVAVVLALAGGIKDIPLCLAGTFLSSVLCSACGLIAAERSRTLNQFILLSVPFEILLCLPPALLLFGHESPYLMLHPGVSAVWLIYGDAPSSFLCALSLMLWSIPALFFCSMSVKRYFSGKGGNSL